MTQSDQPSFGAKSEGIVYTPPVPAADYLAAKAIESPDLYDLTNPAERQGLALNVGREMLRKAVEEELNGDVRRETYVSALGYLLFASHTHQPKGPESVPDPSSWQTRDARTHYALAISLYFPRDKPSARRDIHHVSRDASNAADLDPSTHIADSSHIILNREERLFKARAAAAMVVNALHTTSPESEPDSNAKPGLRRRLALQLALRTMPEL